MLIQGKVTGTRDLENKLLHIGTLFFENQGTGSFVEFRWQVEGDIYTDVEDQDLRIQVMREERIILEFTINTLDAYLANVKNTLNPTQTTVQDVLLNCALNGLEGCVKFKNYVEELAEVDPEKAEESVENQKATEALLDLAISTSMFSLDPSGFPEGVTEAGFWQALLEV